MLLVKGILFIIIRIRVLLFVGFEIAKGMLTFLLRPSLYVAFCLRQMQFKQLIDASLVINSFPIVSIAFDAIKT